MKEIKLDDKYRTIMELKHTLYIVDKDGNIIGCVKRIITTNYGVIPKAFREQYGNDIRLMVEDDFGGF